MNGTLTAYQRPMAGQATSRIAVRTFDDVSRLRKAQRLAYRGWQRGMATAEYAVGILAAVALAIVLYKVFTHSKFFDATLKMVVSMIAKVGAMLPD